MQKEIELKCLCDGLLDALREMGLGKYSLRNYYYEGMWPLIKAYRKAGKPVRAYAGARRIISSYVPSLPSSLRRLMRSR